jgi:cytidylate kinase
MVNACGGDDLTIPLATPGVKRIRVVTEEIVARAAEVAGVASQAIAGSERDEAGETYSTALEQVIRETAEAGDVVIVPLSGNKKVLRVLVTASPESRTRRLAEVDAIELAAAQKAVANSGAARARYFERIYGVKEELPTNYDVTVNTHTMPIDRAARLVMQAALTL